MHTNALSLRCDCNCVIQTHSSFRGQRGPLPYTSHSATARVMTLVIRTVSSAEGGAAARASEDDADGATAASTRGLIN